MWRSCNSKRGSQLLLVVFLASTVAAADDAEFAFNIFSDIAPVLALFGEAFAKQFMSESLSWVDHLIFAMVPLGIITAITSAIRVQGGPTMKAFIGRARETRALSEFECMSSTSGEVCELFNGKSIVRVMGKPKIAQFLIYPEEYRDSEAISKSQPYKTREKHGAKKPREEYDSWESCGIYDLRRARDARLALINHDGITPGPTTIYRNLRRLAANKRETEDAKVEEGDWEANDDDNSIDGKCPEMEPPNLQLNLSHNQFDQGIFKENNWKYGAAILAVAIQMSLIGVASSVAFLLSGDSSNLLESKKYGYPCYVGGSLLLSIGTGLCSIIVGHSTHEHLWRTQSRMEDEKTAPQLIWLQKSQGLNDQVFGAYTMFAGPKRQIIKSSRLEDVKYHTKNGKREERSYWNIVTWELATIVAALAAGFGFVLQFMGLRGLSYPCALAHIGGVFLMTTIRAFIRRRLGNVQNFCRALEGYELESLATRVIFGPAGSMGEKDDDERELFCSWRVKTAGPQSTEPFYVDQNKSSSKRSKGSSPQADQKRPSSIRNCSPKKPNQSKLRFEFPYAQHIGTQKSHAKYPSSQQLLRVRRRLGDLCKWKSKTAESTLALVKSIELFMNTFFEGGEKCLTHLDWRVQTTKPDKQHSDLLPDEWISIPVSVEGKSNADGRFRWHVDTGTVDAVLSLWMADVEGRKSLREAKISMERSQSEDSTKPHKEPHLDWRRETALGDMNYSFYRIIGDNFNDGWLKRDISWWISDSIFDKIEYESEYESEGGPPGEYRRCSDIVIGFNGNHSNCDRSRTSKLGIAATGFLPKILAQHLFTSFMWTVVSKLPKDCLHQSFQPENPDVSVEGLQRSELYRFYELGLRPKLHHKKLTNLTSEMESYGLGSRDELLLCMIPALSSADVLPNHAILELVSPFDPNQDLSDTAKFYKELLETTIHTKCNDRWKIALIASIMDFLYCAHELSDGFAKLSSELESELKSIISAGSHEQVVPIIKKITPLLRMQYREGAFTKILTYFGIGNDGNIFNTAAKQDFDVEYAQNNLGFTKLHSSICKILNTVRMGRRDNYKEVEFIRVLNNSRDELMKERDVFGWTPLHYACLVRLTPLVHREFLKKWLRRVAAAPTDNCGRGVLHVAALAGRIWGLINPSETDKRFFRNSMNVTGIDGMTPLHLLSRSGTIEDLRTWRSLLSITQKDRWGRTALHIATKAGNDAITAELLEMGLRSDELDEDGNCPVEYFVRNRPHQIDFTAGGDPSYINLNEKQRDLFLKLQISKPDCRYSQSRTFLHFAVTVVNVETISQLITQQKFEVNAQDNEGRTPLHEALAIGRTDLAVSLIKDHKADISVADNRGTNALMFAVSANKIYDLDRDYKDFLNVMIGGQGENLKQVDSSGNSALHHAISDHNEAAIDYLWEAEFPSDASNDGPDQREESLLFSACESGFLPIVTKILRRTPTYITTHGMALLSWACCHGHAPVVKELLQYEGVDVMGSDAGNYTPIHLAAMLKDAGCLELLLESGRADVHRLTLEGKTPLQLAIESGSLEAAQILLLHNTTTDQDRVDCIGNDFPYSSGLPILDAIENKAILNQFLLRSLNNVEIEEEDDYAILRAAYSQSKWGKNRNNNHGAILLGKPELVNTDVSGSRLHELDEDRWAWQDYAKQFSRDGDMDSLSHFVEEYLGKESEYATPTALLWGELSESINVTPCEAVGHDVCTTVHDIEVIRFLSDKYEQGAVCIRSDHCIPPPTDQKTYFYFEIEVLKALDPITLGIGFCGVDSGSYPGWDQKSWGFHADDGKVYISSDYGTFPSENFGKKTKYGTNDVVGVCLNTQTGDGFCTLNGVRLNMGNCFKKEDKDNFKFGKMYPCVGIASDSNIDYGLQFRVNFGGSKHHPFTYKGGFNFT